SSPGTRFVSFARYTRCGAIAAGAGFSFLTPSLLVVVQGWPCGAETVCETAEPAARHCLSFDVRTSTFQSAGPLVVCQTSIRLSCDESFGESPSWRYGFSRNGSGSGELKLRIAVTAASAAAPKMSFRMTRLSPYEISSL